MIKNINIKQHLSISTDKNAKIKHPAHPSRLALQSQPHPQPARRPILKKRHNVKQQAFISPAYRQGHFIEHDTLQQLHGHATNQDKINQHTPPLEYLESHQHLHPLPGTHLSYPFSHS